MPPQPIAGGLQETPGHLRVVHGLEPPEAPPVVAQLAGLELVDAGADPPDGAAPRLREESPNLAHLEGGISIRVEVGQVVGDDRRDPVRVAAVVFEGEAHPFLSVGPRLDFAYPDRHGKGARGLSP